MGLAYPEVPNPSGVIDRRRRVFIAGGAAGDHTVTGIATDDELFNVTHLPTGGVSAGLFFVAHTVSAAEESAGTFNEAHGLTAPDVLHAVVLDTGGNVVYPTPTQAKLGFATGTYAMDSDDATANSATIATGLTAVDRAIVQVLDSGGNVVTSDADVTFSAGNIVVADGSTFDVTDGYEVHWVAFDDSMVAPLVGLDITADGTNVTVANGTDQVLLENQVVHIWAADATDTDETPEFGAPDNITSEFSITAADTINNDGGTASTNGWLYVEFYDIDWGEQTDVTTY